MTRWRMTGIALLMIGGMVTAWPAIAAAAEGACGYYANSNGHQVPRPCGDDRSERSPQGATAICRDHSYSFSEHPHAGGTCSHHGGVARCL
jgi:Protein of unknown function (DUF3761)